GLLGREAPGRGATRRRLLAELGLRRGEEDRAGPVGAGERFGGDAVEETGRGGRRAVADGLGPLNVIADRLGDRRVQLGLDVVVADRMPVGAEPRRREQGGEGERQAAIAEGAKHPFRLPRAPTRIQEMSGRVVPPAGLPNQLSWDAEAGSRASL